jgi:hypothetical protein
MHPATGYCKGFPTVFSMVKAQNLSVSTGVYSSWESMHQLFHHTHLERLCCQYESREAHDQDKNYTKKDEIVFTKAVKDINLGKFPALSFVQFSQVRAIGDSAGWSSDEQLDAISVVDEYISGIMNALREHGRLDKTLILLTADNGGCGILHGFYGLHYMVIPFIVSSPGGYVDIRQNYELQMAVSNMDTAATALYALRLQQAVQCTGRPILEAFERFDYEDLHGIPGFGFHFSWLSMGLVEEDADFVAEQCFKGKERCAQRITVINHVFVSGFITGIMLLLFGISCMSVTCYYIRPDRRLRCWGIFDCYRIGNIIKEDFKDCYPDLKDAMDRFRGKEPPKRGHEFPENLDMGEGNEDTELLQLEES